jgi:hypothetical protein
VRLLYFLGVIGLAASVLVNLGSLLGYVLIDALLIIWPLVILLNIVLLALGFNTSQRGAGTLFDPVWTKKGSARTDFWLYNRAWVMRKLPPWTRYLVYLCWAYSAAGIITTAIHLWNHGDVHGDPPKIYVGRGQTRLATPSEVRRDEESALFLFSSVAASGFIYPALYFFLEREEPRRA